MKNFSIIGIGGYIAPKHLDAIKKTGNKLVCCLIQMIQLAYLISIFLKLFQ